MSIDNENSSATPNEQKRKQLLTLLSLFFIAAAVIYFLYWVFAGRFIESTDDAYVNAHIIDVMPQISGTVTAVYTDDTAYVKQDQTLVKLSENDADINLQAAKANLAQTVRQVKTLYDKAEQLQAALVLRKNDLDNAQDDLKRRQNLVNQHAVSKEELQHAFTAEKIAQAQYNLITAQLSAATTQVKNTDLYHHPQVIAAEAKLSNAYLNWSRTSVLAPVNGYVAHRSVQLGQQAVPGVTLLSIVPLHDTWVDANFKESQLKNIRMGQPVELISDAYGSDVKYHGTVVGLSPGTGNTFALLPPQNATGNWIKIVQRLPVRIALDEKELEKYPLRVGLSMLVEINTSDRDGKILANTTSNTSDTTDIYNNQATAINSLINEILQNNAENFTLKNV